MNSFAVEPGSKGSVNVEARGTAPGTHLPGREREQLAGLGVEKDDVPALCLHFLERVRQSPLGDLLKLGVDGEHHFVAGHRVPNLAGRRVVAMARAVLEQHRLARPSGENGVEGQLETGASGGTVGLEPSDDGARELARRIESLEAALEVHAGQRPQGLDLGSVEGAVEIDPALPGPELPVERCGGDTEAPDDEAERGGRVVQLVGSDADVIELLGHGQRHAIAIVERAPARGQHPPLGPAALRELRPVLALHDLELDRSGQQREHAEREAAWMTAIRPRAWPSGPALGQRRKRQQGELGVGRFVQAEPAFRQGNQDLPAATPPGSVAPARPGVPPGSCAPHAARPDGERCGSRRSAAW